MKNTKPTREDRIAQRIREALPEIRREEEAAGIPDDERFPEHFRVLRKDEMHRVRPEAVTDDRYTKVRISICLDLDILNHFKARAAATGTPYQTQINAALRDILEHRHDANPREQLRQAQHLITTALEALP
jgi:uncharacterized protein (DUF4415 family)